MSGQGIVYVLKNRLNGKVYVGQTMKPFEQRLWHHIHNKKPSIIGRAVLKHGLENFDVSINEAPEELLDNLECSLISLFGSMAPNGYNFDSGGHENKHASDITRKKMSDLRKGKRPAGLTFAGKKHSEKTKSMISEAQIGEKNHAYGKPRSLEARRKISEAFKGKGNPFFGKHLSAEHRKKISDSLMGHECPLRSAETRKRMSDAGKGRIFSAEHRRKLAEAGKRRTHPIDVRQKISEANLKRWAKANLERDARTGIQGHRRAEAS